MMTLTGLNHLKDIADQMRGLARSSDAKMFYELLSDSLVWTDEIPELSAGQVGGLRALRYVFRYRSSLLLGKAEERYRPFWELAQSLFPDWPGFAPERRDPELRGSYESFHAEAMRDMSDLFGDMRR
jgi:hypothetical protein